MIIRTHKKDIYFKILKSLVFTGTAVTLFLILTAFFKPKWNYPFFRDNVSYSFKTFFNQPENTDDVIFVGTSHCLLGISPMELYHQNGIISYNLGSSLQPISGTFYLLRETFKSQSPKIVVLDVSSLFFTDTGTDTETDAAWRYILDEMPLARNKLYAAGTYANLTQIQSDNKIAVIKDKMQRFNSVVFPLLQYHTRWDSLNETDFRDFLPETNYYTNGYFLVPDIVNCEVTTDQMNDIANEMHNTFLWTIESHDGETNHTLEENRLYDFNISDSNLEWLKKIKQLCEARGAQLLLVKYPTVHYPQFYSSAWTSLRSDYMKRQAEMLGLPFLDFLYDTDVEIDVHTDFCDGGYHLNYLGSKKVSSYMAKYLSTQYDIQPHQNKQMDDRLALYNKLTEVALLELETDYQAYVSKLKECEDDLLICIAVSDDMRVSLTDDDFHALNSLGLQMDTSWSDEIQTSYLAVIDSGAVLYEELSNHAIDYRTDFEDGTNIFIKSCGWRSGSLAQICINDVDYACNQRGFNIVVVDKATGLVLDSVCFDTYTPEHTAFHKDSLQHLDEYWLQIKDQAGESL